MFSQKKTYTEFNKSSEKISTDILSSRLLKLTELGIITKDKIDGNRKTNIYNLTQKGRELLPVLLEIAEWSHNNLNDHLKDGAKPFVNRFKSNKEEFIQNMYAFFDKGED